MRVPHVRDKGAGAWGHQSGGTPAACLRLLGLRLLPKALLGQLLGLE